MNKTQTISTIETTSNEDFKTAVLVVSVVANAFVFTAWLVAQTSSDYAAQLASVIR